MKVCASMIVFNSDFVLKQCLESIYPYVDQILISEGCVGYWADKGFTTSTDKTNEIIESFPDPEHKITISHGTYKEKLEQSNALMHVMNEDIDYLWQVDADEIYKKEDILKLFTEIQKHNYTSISFRSCTFYGGFSYVMGGFEENAEFKRMFRVYKGSYWGSHRSPSITHAKNAPVLPDKHFSHIDTGNLGIRIYHYSYVYARQVKQKIEYYENAVIKKGQCIPNYFNDVWLSWVQNPTNRAAIEAKYKGVHEFIPSVRGASYTKEYKGTHPIAIERSIGVLWDEWLNQLKIC